MDHIDESMRNQVSALWRVLTLMKTFKEDTVLCQIEEGFFLGSIGAAYNKDELKRLNITHILTVACSLRPAHPNDFAYKLVEEIVTDREETDLRQYFEARINFIDEARRLCGGVLVHCFVG